MEYGGDSEQEGGGGGSRKAGLGFGVQTIKFPVPNASVGLIIDKGREMIKRIQQETGTKVQFDPVN